MTAVEPIDHTEQTFADTAIVSVSDDGASWTTFTFDLVSSATAQLVLKSNYLGFAGVRGSLSSPENGLSPYDPAVSGGDQFDLADLGLTSIRFIRITDSGDGSYLPQYDVDGDLVLDYGNLIDPAPTSPGTGISAGFDLDAVVAIHSEPWLPSAVSDWALYY